MQRLEEHARCVLQPRWILNRGSFRLNQIHSGDVRTPRISEWESAARNRRASREIFSRISAFDLALAHPRLVRNKRDLRKCQTEGRPVRPVCGERGNSETSFVRIRRLCRFLSGKDTIAIQRRESAIVSRLVFALSSGVLKILCSIVPARLRFEGGGGARVPIAGFARDPLPLSSHFPVIVALARQDNPFPRSKGRRSRHVARVPWKNERERERGALPGIDASSF